MFDKKLRKEASAQYSGEIDIQRIPKLKEKDYFIIDIDLDGDAPKEYIQAYFYYKNCPKKSEPLKWSGFYTKFGGKSYPHESVIEFMVNKIGESLGLVMNETRLVIANQQIRFLSKDFLKKGQKLIHGIEILAEYYEDRDFVYEVNRDKKRRRRIFTFQVVEDAIRHVYPQKEKKILENLIKLITFDAIVGNNDRHFYNWGLIGNIMSFQSQNVTFSPIYDSARALLWNYTEGKISEMYKKLQYSNNPVNPYIKKSKPRISFGGNPKANHFELIQYLSSYNKTYQKIIKDLITVEKENYVIEELKKEIFLLFCEKRSILTEMILRKRFEKLRSINDKFH